MPILELDPVTIGQIAAGEVVERPLSVVKELVENALDAGATRVAVRVRGGGIGEIEVADDGSGIAPEELSLAVRRHATSKLAAAGELTRIGTLGFRGEGLAAIAAVARVTIVTRTAGSEIGYALEAYGETAAPVRPAAAPPGTRVTVNDLFANVPARRAYLRSPGAEFGRIASWLGMLTLAYPAVGFTLEHDGRRIFAFAPGEGLHTRLAHVFGREAERMLPVRDDGFDAHVDVGGFISAPGSDRPDRRAQVLIVNGRLLRSTLLAGAWSAAYRTFAMIGRYPYGVIALTIPPDEVDPNVHPTKSDVRLLHAERVLARVRTVLAETLRAAALARMERSISFAPRTIAGAHAAEPAPAVEWAGAFIPAAAAAPELRVLAQVDRTYVLATDGEAVVLIDQHAAHERIVYERLMENARVQAPAEPLLVPHTFEVEGAPAAELEGALPALAAGGLVIEAFGERAFRLVATPAHTVHAGQTRRFDLDDFIECLHDDARGLSADERIWASLACHSVVRAGERLEYAEMVTLVQRLTRCANPMHCPHGRPTIVRLESDALARLFRRI